MSIILESLKNTMQFKLYINRPLLESKVLNKLLFESSVTKIISKKEYGAYEVRVEEWDSSFVLDGGKTMKMTSAYSTYDGSYIGDPKTAKSLVKHNKISRFESMIGGTVSCVGFSEDNQKWYGWSHRAIRGFGVGDKSCEPTPSGNESKGETAKTLEDAKKFAIAFADSVS